MATMKENITNALSWFYDRLKTNDLDPIQEEIDELNSKIGAVYDGTEITSSATVNSWTNLASLDLPAGKYIIIGHVTAEQSGRFTLRVSTNTLSSASIYASSSTSLGLQTVDIASSEKDTTVNLQCYAFASVTLTNIAIRAIRIA